VKFIIRTSIDLDLGVGLKLAFAACSRDGHIPTDDQLLAMAKLIAAYPRLYESRTEVILALKFDTEVQSWTVEQRRELFEEGTTKWKGSAALALPPEFSNVLPAESRGSVSMNLSTANAAQLKALHATFASSDDAKSIRNALDCLNFETPVATHILQRLVLLPPLISVSRNILTAVRKSNLLEHASVLLITSGADFAKLAERHLKCDVYGLELATSIVCRLKADNVVVVCGDSGSGKTVGSILVSSQLITGGKTRRRVAVYIRCHSDDLKDIEASARDKAAAVQKLVKWLTAKCQSLQKGEATTNATNASIGTDAALPKVDDTTTNTNTSAMDPQFCTGGGPCPGWDPVTCSDTTAVIILDEMGGFPCSVRTLCRAAYDAKKGNLRQTLAEILHVGRVEFVAVGTGIDGVNQAPGSEPSSYEVVNASEKSYSVWKTVSAVLPEALRKEISVPSTLDALMAHGMVQNSRAAVALRQAWIRQDFVDGTAHENVIVRPAIPALSLWSALHYKALNGFKGETLESYFVLMAKAVSHAAFPLSQLQLTSSAKANAAAHTWVEDLTELRTTYGVLIDEALRLESNGKRIRNGEYPTRIEEVPAPKKGAPLLYLPKRVKPQHRFRLPAAQVALYRTLLTGYLNRSSNADGFELTALDMLMMHTLSAVHDRARLLTAPPADYIVENSRDANRFRPWSLPADLILRLAKWMPPMDPRVAPPIIITVHFTTKMESVKVNDDGTTTTQRSPIAPLLETATVDGVTQEWINHIAHNKVALFYTNCAQASGNDIGMLWPVLQAGGGTTVVHVMVQTKRYGGSTVLASDDVWAELAKMGVRTRHALIAEMSERLSGAEVVKQAGLVLESKSKANRQLLPKLTKFVKDHSKPPTKRFSVAALTEAIAELKDEEIGCLMPERLFPTEELEKMVTTKKRKISVMTKRVLLVYGSKPDDVEIQNGLDDSVALIHAPKATRSSYLDPTMWPLPFCVDATAGPIQIGGVPLPAG